MLSVCVAFMLKLMRMVMMMLSFVEVHPSHQYFVAAECGTNPDINVFEYPSLKLYRILRGGAERTYVNMDFRQVQPSDVFVS